jgi:hypothetical protein
MKKGRSYGFDYYLSNETIKKYQEKPLELRLKWLYMGNLFRKQCSINIVRLHNKFREGKKQ